MPKSPNQKNRLLVLERIFLQETDEQHALTLKELQAKLRAHDIQAERKTLYADFECLTQAGIEIFRDEHDRYYTESRLFETAELKLLADAVASSRFLTEKKSASLIQKLTSLASKSSAHELNRNLRVAGKAKTDNEAVLYNVDALHTAIRENKQITFLYFDLNVAKQKQYRKSGARYAVSPWALLWDDEKYYLLAYDVQAESLKNYRVDKMERISITDTPREGADAFAAEKIETYSDRTFGMFRGDEETVTLQAENSLASVLIDRFGADTVFLQDGDTFRATVRVSVSGNFYGWVFSFGGRVKILSPAHVKQDFEEYLQRF